MAHDDRHEDERRSRAQRLGDRNFRGETDDPEYGMERYGSGPARGVAGGLSSDPDSIFGAPGYDAEFGGPRFDRINVGSIGTHGVHPVSSPYGGAYRGAVGVTPGGGFRSSARRYALAEGGQHRHDPHYAEWRSRQIEQLDRDYDEYRSENQQRFEQEFGAWRQRRGTQREAVGRVTEHMEVIGSDGSHVGTVDCTKGDRIILTRSDPKAGGHHHSIPCGWVDSVDDKVKLNLTAGDATERWRNEEQSRALFEREEEGGEGPHMLNRSFSGTYRGRDRD